MGRVSKADINMNGDSLFCLRIDMCARSGQAEEDGANLLHLTPYCGQCRAMGRWLPSGSDGALLQPVLAITLCSHCQQRAR